MQPEHVRPEHADAAPPDVAAALGTMLRALHRVRERFRAQASRRGLDWSSLAVLSPVVEAGPARVTALADSVQLAPSTVSRMVAHLIDEGLLERHADAADGRAWIVAPTPSGRAAYAELRRVRDEYLNSLMRDWTPQDRADFARLLARLATAMEAKPQGGSDPKNLTAMGIR